MEGNIQTHRCPFCEKTTYAVVAKNVRDFEYDSEGTYQWVSCSNCALIGLSPQPSLAILEQAYPPGYHAYLPPKSKITQTLVKKSNLGAATQIRSRLEEGQTVLDIGCSSGALLGELSTLGRFQLWGVEFDPKAAEAARSKGIRVWQGDFDKADVPEGSVDLIILRHVLEHVYDPKSFLEKVYRCLKPGGSIVGELPNFDSWDRALFGRFWGGGHAPRHMWHFTPVSLLASLQKTEFQEVKMKPSLHTGHWAMSFQNYYKSLTARRFKNGRSAFYPFLLLALVPINMIQYLFCKTGVIRFEAKKLAKENGVQLPVSRSDFNLPKLNKEEIAHYSKVRNVRAIWTLSWVFVAIAACFTLVALVPHPVSYVLSFLAIGALQHHLNIIQHDAIHRHLVTNPKWNEFLGKLTSYPIGFTMKYRLNHFSHHVGFATPKDPDYDNYCKFPNLLSFMVADFTRCLVGVAGVTQYLRTKFGKGRDTTDGEAFDKELIGVALTQLFIFAVLALTSHWIFYFTLWLLPLATLAKTLTRIRNVAEHVMLRSNGVPELSRLRTFRCGWIEQFFIAPLSFNFHAEHHFYPEIPYYNLKKVHEILKTRGDYSKVVDLRKGYLAVLFMEMPGYYSSDFLSASDPLQTAYH